MSSAWVWGVVLTVVLLVVLAAGAAWPNPTPASYGCASILRMVLRRLEQYPAAMPFEQLIALAQLGGFVFASAVLAFSLWQLFAAWRRGDLVSRPVHDAMVKLLVDANASLRADLQLSVRETARLADAVERVADTLNRHDGDVRAQVAEIRAVVQARSR